MNLFDNYQAYDIVKNMASTCLESYDSYFTSFYKLNTPEANTEHYYVYCGNLEGSEGQYFFNGYREYSIHYKPGESTFNIGHNSSTSVKKISDLDFSRYEHFTNIPYYNEKYINILSTTNSSTSSDNSSANIPFSREEFILLPFLLCILVLMLFLKWCFPMKGEKNL